MSELPTHCRAGYCTWCGELVWRAATAARNDERQGIRAGQQFILWPQPDSVYAVLETPSGYAPGIAFCADCAPAIGERTLEGFGPTLRIETARERYAAWFTDQWGAVRRLWLRDALSLEPPQVDALMTQWQMDRSG